MQIDPWGPGQVQDYAKLRTEFGLGAVDASTWQGIEDPHPLFERGVVFAHRGLDNVLGALRRGDPFGVMTGLMPSGKMHLGHKSVIDQAIWYQNHGGDVHIAIADFEAYAARGLSIPQAQQLGLEEYVLTYLALGLDPKKAEVYFQTQRSRVKDLAYRLGLHVSMRTMKALYGFQDDVKLAHVNAPLMQAGDILHVQGAELGGPRPVVVPVGVDQDPHIRLTRDLAAATRIFSVTATKDQKIGVFVKPERPPKDVKVLLSDVEKILRTDVGFSDLKRNDAYRAIYVNGASESDIPRIDLALGQYESKELGEPGFFAPSSTYHRFMTGLVAGPDGKPGKMSSSKPETAIFLSDDPATVEKKVKHAVTGGLPTAEEQRRKGANPYACSVYELYLYHVADDKTLQTVFEECTTGKRLCGECKVQALGLLQDQLRTIQEKREASRHLVKEIVSQD
jgi:tryptophanyl-tRNA synthetase